MQLTKTKLRNLLGDENLEDLLFMCWNVGGLNQLDTELLVILIVGGKFGWHQLLQYPHFAPIPIPIPILISTPPTPRCVLGLLRDTGCR